MRVIAGKYGSRQLKAVPGSNTRPTTDKIKESIFNLLGGYFDGGTVLDLYGGTGALAIEAISRGMSHAIICEKNRQALATIKQNIEITKEPALFTVLAGPNRVSLGTLQAEQKFVSELVFIDPPYKLEQTVADILWLLEQEMIDEYSTIVCETDDQTDLPEMIGSFEKVKEKKYGLTMIRIYRWKETL